MDDGELEVLVSELNASLARVEAAVGKVPGERWGDVVHTGEGAWTRHDLLRHMAANDGRQMIRVRIGGGLPEPGDAELHEAELDVDRWNAARVRERDGRDVAALVAEMRDNRAALVALLRGLTPKQRDRPMPYRGRPTALAEMIAPLNRHLEVHAEELVSGL